MSSLTCVAAEVNESTSSAFLIALQQHATAAEFSKLSGRLFRTKLFLRWTGAVWCVRQVYLYRDGEPEPFATSGPTDP